jgi:co-chaperonin GroES (HSP10)
MRDQLIRTETADYVAREWDGKNTSGYRPIGDHVLVLPDTASDKAGKHGLIHLPQDQIERMSLASESGILAALGDDSFTWNTDRTRPFAGQKPVVGDRVVFDRYAGRVIRGRDGRTYRLMTDTCIGGIAEQDEKNDGR